MRFCLNRQLREGGKEGRNSCHWILGDGPMRWRHVEGCDCFRVAWVTDEAWHGLTVFYLPGFDRFIEMELSWHLEVYEGRWGHGLILIFSFFFLFVFLGLRLGLCRYGEVVWDL